MAIKKLIAMDLSRFSWQHLLLLLLSLTLVIGLILVPAQPVQAAGNTYYVAKTGSDSNPGTITRPWLTIQKAFSTATAGDTVNVRAGTYNEAPDVKNSGSASGGYITFQAYNGETVIINGNGVYKWEGIITIHGKSYIKLIGFYIANGISVNYEAGVYIGKGSDHILLQSLDITNTSISGILAENSTNITVYSCHIHDTNTEANHEMISFSGVNGFEIAYCDVHDPASDRRCLIDVKVGCQNGIIHHNKVHGAIANGAYGIYVDGGYTSPIADTINISIYSNQIYDMPNASVGIGLAVETGDANLVNIRIYNNLIWNVDRAFVTDSNVGREKVNFIFAYNTLYGSRMSEIFITSSPAFLNNCVVANNIVYNTGSTGYLCVLGPNYAYTLSQYSSSQLIIDKNIFFSDVGSYPTVNQLGTNAIKQDPLFKSISINDFHLLTGSPAIDRGTVAYAPSVDYDGNARSQGAGYDIGSYEMPITAAVLDHITITPSNPSVAVGDTQTYSAQGYDSSNNLISGLTYTWSLTNPTVGSISSSGLFTAGTTAGIYPNVIQAVSDGKTCTASVTVTGAVLDYITVSPANPSIGTSETQTYRAQGYDSNNNPVSGLTYNWSVNNPIAGSINYSGFFTAGTTAGIYPNVIQAVSDGITGTASIIVTAGPLDHIMVSPSNPSVETRGNVTFSAQGYDSDNNPISGLIFAWSITDPTVGSINSNGVFTAKKTVGNYPDLVQVVSSGETGTASVIVTYAKADVNMDGYINDPDITLVSKQTGKSGSPAWIREDTNADGVINVLDSIIIGQKWIE